MSSRLVSPVFAGRERELTRLTTVYADTRTGSPRFVLVGGEAGGGKSRLVHEFIARTHDDAYVLIGGCLELGPAGLPYAPFTAALRQLARERGVREVAKLLPDGAAADLAGLLPEFGDLPPDPDAGTARARLFERMLSLMERLADQRPLIWVIEDAHWADRSTRDLLDFLVRNLRAGPLLLITTFRSDELHRTHPLRPLLAELQRVEGVTRLELPRLSRDEVASQLAGILGHPPTPAMLDQVGDRADGIPLFVEAMVDSKGGLSRSLPASLRDLLATAVQRLPEPTQEILRVATATERAGHALLAAVTGLDEAALAAALRPAVAANVLVPDRTAGQDGYAFRHALIREAIREDLLPGERTRIHRRFAEVLEADLSLSPGDRPSVELAMHWYAAHDAERALCTAWTAAQASAAAHAYAEQVQLLERVLELWDRIPDAADQIGTDHVGVLEVGAAAARTCGDPERGLAFVRAALADLDERRDPERVALLLVLRAKLRDDRALPGELDDLRAAERLVPEPSAARVRVLSTLSGSLTLNARIDEALPLAKEALSLARELGAEWAEANALVTLALVATGPREALDLLEAAREKAERSGYGEITIRALINISAVLMEIGDNERGAEAAHEAFTRARPLGRVRTHGAFAAENLAEAQILMGRWDEAVETLRRVDELGPVSGMVGLLRTLYGKIAVARGHVAAASRAIKEANAFFGSAASYPHEFLPFVVVMIEHCLASGDTDLALETVERGLKEQLAPAHSTIYAWSFLSVAMRACADVPEPAAARASALRERLYGHAEQLPASGPVAAAHRSVFLAESPPAGGDGVANGDAWETAVSAWAELDQPYALAYARYRAAAALLAGRSATRRGAGRGGGREAADGESEGGHGGRAAAEAHLRAAAELAHRLGAQPLYRQVRQLARRAGCVLDTDSGGDSADHGRSRLGLTPRELEVLRLVADGNSNREIAEKLFITAKTASVHVSNILGKLAVASRGEAAATAHRLRLFDRPL